MTKCLPRASRTRGSRHGARAPFAPPCRPRTWAMGLVWLKEYLKKRHLLVMVMGHAEAMRSKEPSSWARHERIEKILNVAAQSHSWETTARRLRCSIHPTLCPRTDCWRGLIVATRCGRSSASVCGGRVVSFGFCGECSCRQRARMRTESAWGCGRANPLAATTGPEPLCGHADSMPHYQSRQDASGGALLPKSLRCCLPPTQVRHAWPRRRQSMGRVFLGGSVGVVVVVSVSQECWGGGRPDSGSGNSSGSGSGSANGRGKGVERGQRAVIADCK
jgi:hypothetical protein